MDRLPLFPAGPPPSALDAAGPLRRNPSCNRCQFGDRAIKRCLPPVSVGGAGGLLVVGSFPDRVANVSGQGFSDHAGRYTVEAVGKAWKGPAAFTYAVNCHPGEPTGGGAAPEEKHVVKCRPYVRSYAEQVAPTRILLLGELACWAVLGRSVSTRSVRRGFAWVQLPHGRVPALILMNPAVLDGRFARAAWESDLQWACSTPDSFFEERFQLIAEATYSVVRTAEEGAEAIDDLTRAALAVSRGLAWDVESRGKLHDPDFRIISAAIGLEGENHSYVWDRRALETPEVQAHLVGAIRDPRLLFIEQGSYDERASLCYFDTPIAGDRHDVRLLRKMLDCAVPKADLDTMSEMVGFGGYKDEFGAELAAVKDRVKKWNPRQTLLFDGCPDPEARLRLWEIYQSKDPKLVDDYEDSYRYALVPTAKLSIYNARDQVATGLLHRLFWPQVRADDGLSLLWDEVTGPASRSYTWGEHWGAPISRTAIEAVIHYSNLTKAQIEPQLRAHLTPTFKNLNLASVEQVSAFLYTPAALGGLGLPVPKKTKKGANSLDDEALEELENRTKHPFVSLFRAFVSSDTDRKKAEEFRRFLRADGCMHPSYLLDGTKTGRPSCVAKGTFIEVVRDASAHPRGIPIEDVKVGDLVYCYDEEGELRIRPVTATIYSGVKRVIRVHWQGSGHQHKGYVDLTPEHLVKRTDGKWVEARNLKPLDRVFALRRGTRSNGYARLWVTGDIEIAREHRFVFKEVFGYEPPVVHHINENPLDNRPSNLEATDPSSHAKHHIAERVSDPEWLKANSELMRDRWKNDREKMLAGNRASAEKNSLNLSREEVIAILDQHDWSMTRARDDGRHDYETLQKYVVAAGFTIEEVIAKAASIAKSKGGGKGNYPCKNCGEKGHRRKTCPQPLRDNHEIVSIEILEDPVDVYDLTVDGVHSFIANEVCVHNCHAPNLYNLKSPEDCEECNGKGCAACDGTGTDEESRRIRSCIEAPDDFVILEADESQVELRGMAMFCREEVLIEAYVNRRDIHQETIDFVFEVCGVRIVRRFAKVGNFMIPYGGTDFSFGARLKLPPEEAKIIYGSIVNRYPRVNAKKRQMLAEAQHTGCSYNLWFRDGQEVVCQKRPLWDLDSRDGSRKRKAENGLLNTAIQGTYSGSLILASHARLVEYILRNNLQHLWRPSVNVYDSIIGPVHKALLPLAARLTVDVMTSWVIGRLPDGRPFPLEADCKMGKSLGVAKKYKPPATVREAVEECKKLGLQELLKKPEQTNRIAGSRWGL